MNLIECMQSIDDEIKNLDAAGVVIILALEGAPMMIRCGTELDHAQELCKIMSTSKVVIKQ